MKGSNPKFTAVLEAFAADPKLSSVVDALAESKMVDGGKFGANALKVNGKIFAMVVKEKLVVKLPRARVDGLVAARVGESFDPGHGRKMKEWVVILGPRLSWIDLAKEAHDYVRG